MFSWIKKIVSFRGVRARALGKSDAEASRLITTQGGSKLATEATVDHLMRGYDNTQQVVQFMDAKAAAVIAMSIGVFVLLAGSVSWLYDRSGEENLLSCLSHYEYASWFTLALIVGSVVAGGVCLKYAFKTVRPNGLPKEEHFAVLFPVVYEPWNNVFAKSYLDKFVELGTDGTLLEDIKRQLLAMGGIVYAKIGALRVSITCLQIQTCLTVAMICAIGILVAKGCLPAEKSEVTELMKDVLLELRGKGQ